MHLSLAAGLPTVDIRNGCVTGQVVLLHGAAIDQQHKEEEKDWFMPQIELPPSLMERRCGHADLSKGGTSGGCMPRSLYGCGSIFLICGLKSRCI